MQDRTALFVCKNLRAARAAHQQARDPQPFLDPANALSCGQGILYYVSEDGAICANVPVAQWPCRERPRLPAGVFFELDRILTYDQEGRLEVVKDRSPSEREAANISPCNVKETMVRAIAKK